MSKYEKRAIFYKKSLKSCRAKLKARQAPRIKRIAIQTANEYHAHTDDHITLTVKSDAGSCSTKSINGGKYHHFHRGQHDNFSGHSLGKFETRIIFSCSYMS